MGSGMKRAAVKYFSISCTRSLRVCKYFLHAVAIFAEFQDANWGMRRGRSFVPMPPACAGFSRPTGIVMWTPVNSFCPIAF